MARDVATTRIPGTDTRESTSEPVVPKPASTPRNFFRPLSLVPHRLTAAERRQRICDLAYRRAEQRGFAPGNEIEDWLDAEREVDAGRY
jgi:Protein of unknown function (DUF2934)